MKTIETKDEGDIVLCQNLLLPISNTNILSYVTQRGSLYFHDMRARYNIHNDSELLGCQKGIPTCMSVGQNPYQLYFGTLGGYVMLYDIRYHILSA